jgi:hypothetical protein
MTATHVLLLFLAGVVVGGSVHWIYNRLVVGEAKRALKRQLSDVVYRRMHADAKRRAVARGGQSGTRLASA